MLHLLIRLRLWSPAQTKPATPSSIQEEISRIRVERERLSRLMELEKMEERLRQQMVRQKPGRGGSVELGVTTKIKTRYSMCSVMTFGSGNTVLQ
jgi:hypothetical protein